MWKSADAWHNNRREKTEPGEYVRPNRNDTKLFKQRKQYTLEAGNTNILIVRDWNLLLKPEVDGMQKT